MKKNIIKVTVFVLVFAVCALGMRSILRFKYLDSIFKAEMFYEQQEESVDVLVLGTSHSYQGINPAVLWDEYGYAAYDLAGSGQPIWNTYYYLEEALKTQTPKVIILDVFAVSFPYDYSEESFAIKNTYGLKWSKTKINAIKASVDFEEYGSQFLIELLQYHSRYSDLDEIDFSSYQANKDMYESHKGFYCYFRTVVTEDKDYSDVTEATPLSEKNEMYYRMILELAQSNDIPIIAVAIPFDANENYIKYFNSAEAIAEEYGVPFLNFMTDYKEDIGLSYIFDFADNNHLNFRGGEKLTKFMGSYLQENYSIPDRRGDEAYSSWDDNAEVYYSQVENYNITQIDNLTDLGEALTDERFTVIVTCDGSEVPEKNSLSASVHNFCVYMGIDEDLIYKGGVWIFEEGGLSYYSGLSEELTKYVRFNRYDDAKITVAEVQGESEDESSIETEIYVNKTEQSAVSSGLNVYIYDNLTKTTVDSVGFDFSNYELKRADG
ncbi:MAG: DUF1574 domain-containing protein [Clostridiales bacterium]|nr:DUF1574 domain-containing protein [Clostridiales bacterium]